MYCSTKHARDCLDSEVLPVWIHVESLRKIPMLLLFKEGVALEIILLPSSPATGKRISSIL